MLVVAGGVTLGLPRTVSRRGEERIDRDSLVAGIRFIAGTRVVLGAILLDLVAVLFGDAIALAPVFAKTILEGGPVVLGLLRAAPSAGALLAGLLITRRPLPVRAGRALLLVVAAFGAATIVVGLSRSPPLSPAVLAVTGVVGMISLDI